jgi:hypothetical protein
MKPFLVLLALVLLGVLAAHLTGVGRPAGPFDGIFSSDSSVRVRSIAEFPVDLARGELRPDVIPVVRRLLVDPEEDVRMAADEFAGRVGLTEVTAEVEALPRLQGQCYQDRLVRHALDLLRASR